MWIQILTKFTLNSDINCFVTIEKSVSQIYHECKDVDGFLYCKYASENFTGWVNI